VSLIYRLLAFFSASANAQSTAAADRFSKRAPLRKPDECAPSARALTGAPRKTFSRKFYAHGRFRRVDTGVDSRRRTHLVTAKKGRCSYADASKIKQVRTACLRLYLKILLASSIQCCGRGARWQRRGFDIGATFPDRRPSTTFAVPSATAAPPRLRHSPLNNPRGTPANR